MAGEKKGKAYEAFVKVALEKLKHKGVLRGSIFWDDKPEEMTIIPDLTIGKTKDDLDSILLITHSGSAKESEKKGWRNMGELVEAKVCLPIIPRVYNIAFDSIIKENLKKAQAASFDGQLIVGDLKYGPSLQNWIDNNLSRIPKDKDEKVDFLKSEASTDKEIRSLLNGFSNDLEKLIKKKAPVELDQLWKMEINRQLKRTPRVPRARNTFVRRGFIKTLLIGEIPGKHSKVNNGDPVMEKLGLVKKIIGGYRASDEEYLWVKKFGISWHDLKKVAKKASTAGFFAQLEKVRNIILLPVLTKWVEDHYDELINDKKMVKWLQMFHKQPQYGLTIPKAMTPPNNLWLFDVIGALSKAAQGRSQDFGYSSFSKHPSSHEFKNGSMWIGDWCSCFMNQYFNRKQGFNPPLIAISHVAKVLSEALADIPKEEIVPLAIKIEEKYIAKEYEATLLAHRGFEPLLGLILESGVMGKKESFRSCFGERAKLSGQATKTTLLKTGKTLINWQSAHSSHTNDKKKELCGRAVSLRYSWDSKTNRFIVRPGIGKLILVVDGTWNREDLKAMARAGWDEIYYPDEMAELAKAIV